jgi:hypothetical protein
VANSLFAAGGSKSVALKQLTASIPQAAQLKIADFIDRSLISELENEGFISKIYDVR